MGVLDGVVAGAAASLAAACSTTGQQSCAYTLCLLSRVRRAQTWQQLFWQGQTQPYWPKVKEAGGPGVSVSILLPKREFSTSVWPQTCCEAEAVHWSNWTTCSNLSNAYKLSVHIHNQRVMIALAMTTALDRDQFAGHAQSTGVACQYLRS